MIAKGNLHAHGAKLAAYLTTAKDGERAELVELRGFVADNIRDAFTDVQIQAEATRATKPFFHAYVRLPEGEGQMAVPQWQHIADRIEQGLGFEGQGRAVAFHHQANGETHMHMAWSRIDLESMKAIDPGLYKNKLKEICRELEIELGLTCISSDRAADNKTRSADRNEFEQSRRLGTDLKAIRNTIQDCWQSADSGRAFAAALDERGLILARGDRRDFVVVDREGGEHALGKRITGASAAETRARLADIDTANLPDVENAKAIQYGRSEPMSGPEVSSQKYAEVVSDHSEEAEKLRKDQVNSLVATPAGGLVAQQREAMDRFERNSNQMEAERQAALLRLDEAIDNPGKLDRPEQVSMDSARQRDDLER
jgi:hypothetical protein